MMRLRFPHALSVAAALAMLAHHAAAQSTRSAAKPAAATATKSAANSRMASTSSP